MQVADIPERWRPKLWNSASEHFYGVAEAFWDAVQNGLNPDTNRIYLPVFWSNNYHEQHRRRREPVFRAVPELQVWLDNNIDPTKEYFTVTRADEGIYEYLPKNVLVFGAGDNADVVIPLANSMAYSAPKHRKKHLACFVGVVQCGGPRTPHGVSPKFSDYDPTGIGTRIRMSMREAASNRGDCLLVDQDGSTPEARQTFIDAMRDSHYALCPRGYAPTSFRLYEAMALGTVPLYISDRWLMPYADRGEWQPTCVRVAPDRVGEALSMAAQDTFAYMADNIARLYDSHFSLAGTCQQISRYLEDARCSV